MAGIDKIYGTWEEQEKLRKYCEKADPDLLDYLYGYEEGRDIRPISNFSNGADGFLWDNCPLNFVKERLKEQYNGEHPIRGRRQQH